MDVVADAGQDLGDVGENDCWACELARGERGQHKTRWFYLSPNVGAVVEDLRSKGCDMRLLHVPVEHVPCGAETEADREASIAILTAVARHLPEYEVVKLDVSNHSFGQHWHVQACLKRRK